MSVKVIVTDMDGTFLNDAKTYNQPRFMAQYQELKKRGIKFVVASGNQYYQLISFFPELKDEISFVAENGALVYEHGKQLFHGELTRHESRIVIGELLKDKQLNFVACGLQSAYVSENAPEAFVALMAKHYHRLKPVKDYQEIDDVLFKFSLNLPDEQIPLVIDKLHIALDGIMKPVTSGFGFIDLIIPGLHKANGISRLLKRWDLSPQNVVAIGDSGNDAEMLKMARYSFAMGNAAENIKQIARYATDDNNHEGALNVIQAVLDYLDRNRFDEVYKGPGDNFFGTLSASRPEIYPIYWSQAQMQARQSEEMANAQSFLNRLWTFESDGKQWFNPDVSVIYPDRIRRRPPGTTSKGLGAHTDSGALERWLLPAYQRVFANVFNGNLAQYDPWHAAHRTEVEEYTVDNTTKCSVFRTFQGWTALSDMLPGQGLLHVVPIPEAMAYVLLRPLLDDVPEDELCGVAPGRVLPVSEQWHPLLIEALTSIPKLEAGDSVWWHCDVIHSVAPVENQQGWGNVMYIPAAPMCEKNLAYAHKVKAALEKGASPGDFPREDYETNWEGRFTLADLNIHGKRALGIDS